MLKVTTKEFYDKIMGIHKKGIYHKKELYPYVENVTKDKKDVDFMYDLAIRTIDAKKKKQVKQLINQQF